MDSSDTLHDRRKRGRLTVRWIEGVNKETDSSSLRELCILEQDMREWPSEGFSTGSPGAGDDSTATNSNNNLIRDFIGMRLFLLKSVWKIGFDDKLSK